MGIWREVQEETKQLTPDERRRYRFWGLILFPSLPLIVTVILVLVVVGLAITAVPLVTIPWVFYSNMLGNEPMRWEARVAAILGIVAIGSGLTELKRKHPLALGCSEVVLAVAAAWFLLSKRADGSIMDNLLALIGIIFFVHNGFWNIHETIQADPKLKAAYDKHQVAMGRGRKEKRKE